MIASTKSPLPWHYLLIKNALKINAPLNGLIAKKTLNASQPFKTVKRSVEQKLHAGLYAYHQKEVKLQLMSPNAPKQMDVLDQFLKSHSMNSQFIKILKIVSLNTARLKKKPVLKIEDVFKF
jgi:hypothetical protein